MGFDRQPAFRFQDRTCLSTALTLPIAQRFADFFECGRLPVPLNPARMKARTFDWRW
jgi:hypothetical protein